jgi:hypothetical protein
MRLYNVRPSEREFSFGKMSVVALGERGRARKETLVPFHAPPPTYTTYTMGISEESFYIIGVSRSGAPKIMRGEGASPGWIAVLSGKGVYTRGTYGTVYLSPDIAAATHPRTAPVQILAEGYGAFGLAGRVGGWHEFLVTLSPSSDSDPVIFYVRPAGGARKIERYFLVFTASAVYRVYDAERTAFEAATGIILPPSIEGWLDLADVKTQEPAETEKKCSS